MAASGWIVAGVLLIGAAGIAWWSRAGEREEPIDLAVVGEVRGAPLRAPVEGAAVPATAKRAEGASAGADALGDDYADLLPKGAADEYEWIDFPLLMDFDFPGLVSADVDPEDLLPPEEVMELHGEKIAIEGFMNPLSFDARGVSEFTLVADPAFCCFGMTPQLNHFIHVTLPKGERCDFFSMVPVAVFGTFSAGAEIEDGIVLSIYRLEAQHVISVY